MGVVDVDVGGVVSGLFDGFDNLFTSDEERLAAEYKLKELLHLRLQGQVETNKIEAAHPSVFVSGWRPALGWVCVSGIGYEFVFRPMATWISNSLSVVLGNPIMPAMPTLNIEQLMSLVVAMLGVAGYRTYEKTKDKARIK